MRPGKRSGNGDLWQEGLPLSQGVLSLCGIDHSVEASVLTHPDCSWFPQCWSCMW